MLRIVHGVKSDRLVRDRHFDPKLLRLVIGPRHQCHAGNSGREAEIILYACRSPCLAAERAAIQHQDREALRARVHRCGETGRPGSDDCYVEGPAGINRAYQPDATRELDVSWITQQLATGTQNDRQIAVFKTPRSREPPTATGL